MTPDEVVKVLEEYYDEIKSNRFPNKYLSEKQIALQSAISLISDYQKLRERVDNKDKIEEIIHSISFWHQGKSTHLDYKKECHYCNDRPWLNKIAQAIVTYLQQPTEH